MRRRTGFTLVEVLVSMALILFIMSILSAAFVAATSAVSDLKAAGDLADKLRGAVNVIRRDLEQDHFTDHVSGANPRLSTLWSGSPGSPPPALGFFRIYEGSPGVPEGVDLDNIPSFYQTTAALHFTVALTGSKRSDFLAALVPPNSPLTTPQSPAPDAGDLLLKPPDQRYQDTPNVYNSQLAEVALFLAPTGDQTDSGTPLYALYRRQFLAVPTGWTPPPPGGNPPPSQASEAPNYLEVSTVPSAPEPGAGALTFNDMAALTMPVRRFWMNRTNAAGTYNLLQAQYPTMTQSGAGETILPGGFQSADLILTDVLSFDVRVLVPADNDFHDLSDAQVQQYSGGNLLFSSPNLPRVFDTWSNQTDTLTGKSYLNWMTPGSDASIPLYKNSSGQTISIQAIQVTLRVWDFKTKKTRQVTMVQQM